MTRPEDSDNRMRRAFVGTTVPLAALGLAGCSGAGGETPTTRDGSTTTTDETTTSMEEATYDSGYETTTEFLAVATALGNTGAATYEGAAPTVSNDDVPFRDGVDEPRPWPK